MSRQRRANAELEALRASTTLVRDSVLGDTGGSSSLAVSLTKAAKEAATLASHLRVLAMVTGVLSLSLEGKRIIQNH
jgi:hypothetical protein